MLWYSIFMECILTCHFLRGINLSHNWLCMYLYWISHIYEIHVCTCAAQQLACYFLTGTSTTGFPKEDIAICVFVFNLCKKKLYLFFTCICQQPSAPGCPLPAPPQLTTYILSIPSLLLVGLYFRKIEIHLEIPKMQYKYIQKSINTIRIHLEIQVKNACS